MIPIHQKQSQEQNTIYDSSMFQKQQNKKSVQLRNKKYLLLSIIIISIFLVLYIFVNYFSSSLYINELQDIQIKEQPKFQTLGGLLYEQIQNKVNTQISNLFPLKIQLPINKDQYNKIKNNLQHLDNLNKQLSALKQQVNFIITNKKLRPHQLLTQKDSLQRIFQIREQLKIMDEEMNVRKISDQYDRYFQYYRQSYKASPINFLSYQQKSLYIPSRQQLLKYQQKKDLIIYTPAGRKLYLQILFKYLSKQNNSFYKWHIWMNTNNTQDVEFINKIAKQNQWIKIIRLQTNRFDFGSIYNIRDFWSQDCEKDKIYMRLDDDIIWMSQDFVDKMFEARIKYPEPLFIYPNIVNNAIIDYLHQRAGIFEFQTTLQYDCMGNAWRDPLVGKQIHQQFLESVKNNQTQKWSKSFNRWYLHNYERISINSLIYFSNTLRTFKDIKGDGQQQLFSADIPYYYRKKNLILGYPICVHEGFYNQRKVLAQNPQIIKQYRKLADL